MEKKRKSIFKIVNSILNKLTKNTSFYMKSTETFGRDLKPFGFLLIALLVDLKHNERFGGNQKFFDLYEVS